MPIYGLQIDSVSPLAFAPALRAMYLNGKWAERPVSFGRGRVWIDVTGGAPYDAHWADVENQDMTPQAFPAWNNEKHRALGQWGGVYCNRTTLPAVLDALGSMPADLWLSTLDGDVNPPELGQLPPNVHPVAVQAFPAGMLGFNADASVIIDQAYWDTRHA